MRRVISLFIGLFIVMTMGMTTACVKGKKSCKASHKRVKQMRKSGQIKF